MAKSKPWGLRFCFQLRGELLPTSLAAFCFSVLLVGLTGHLPEMVRSRGKRGKHKRQRLRCQELPLVQGVYSSLCRCRCRDRKRKGGASPLQKQTALGIQCKRGYCDETGGSKVRVLIQNYVTEWPWGGGLPSLRASFSLLENTF